MTRIEIRPERSSDHPRVDEIQRAAFGRNEEAELVTALREPADSILSLVAEIPPVRSTDVSASSAANVAGHVFFSPVTLEGPGDPPPLAGLAPLAVDAHAQTTGIGSALVRAGLRDCLSLGWQAVFLLGNPAYYSRFGFSLAAPQGFRYESEAFDGGFQMIELVPGALTGCSGWIRYHPAFSEM